MTPHLARIGVIAAAAPALALAGVTTVSAHVVKTFGPYTIAIGWQHEPTYAGQLNAVQLIVKDASGNPINDLTSSDLHVQVSYAGTTGSTLDFKPSFDADTGLGTPGEYDAAIMPTVPGDYTFHLNANLHGTMVTQAFTSGDTTFDTVHAATSVDFPQPVPDTLTIYSRVLRDSHRLDAAIADAHSASDAGSRATLLGVIALVVGVLVGGAGLAVAVRRRKTA